MAGDREPGPRAYSVSSPQLCGAVTPTARFLRASRQIRWDLHPTRKADSIHRDYGGRPIGPEGYFMSINLLTIWRAAFAAAVLCVCAFAQNGSISGTIKDSQGAVIPRATVTVNNFLQGVTQTSQSSADGNFVF